jgi:hypothetical protein
MTRGLVSVNTCDLLRVDILVIHDYDKVIDEKVRVSKMTRQSRFPACN